ncbi:MAG: hypothetical protein IJ642_03625 [Oscillospiraceae bacterium]|nr:hypothetical protein [Oscillospiraceae bacterium]
MAQSPQQNFDAMRQDAIRRSREMQRRAVPMPPPEQPLKPPVPRPEQPPLSEELHHLLTGWDSEKLTLLALLYLLYKEGAEPELLLALAYILL